VKKVSEDLGERKLGWGGGGPQARDDEREREGYKEQVVVGTSQPATPDINRL
jgi:hypothetical protein